MLRVGGLFLVVAIGTSTLAGSLALAPEPYHVIHVHMEAATGDAIEARRGFDEQVSDAKRSASMSEADARADAKYDAAMAAQAALLADITDVGRNKLRSRAV